jgi:hypothetical protein
MATTDARHGAPEGSWQHNEGGGRDMKIYGEEEGGATMRTGRSSDDLANTPKKTDRALLSMDETYAGTSPSLGALPPFDEEVERIGNGWFQYAVRLLRPR